MPVRRRTWLQSGVLLALTGCLFALQHAYRGAEAALSAQIVAAFANTRTGAVPDRAVVFFGLGRPDAIGLRITPECTSAFLIVPLILVAVAMLWLRPAIARRVLIGLAVGTVVLILTNQLRILVVVWLVEGMGLQRGYYWGHTMLGSMVSVVGGAVCLVAFVRYALVKRPVLKQPEVAA